MSEPRVLLFAPSAYPLGGVATWISYLLPGLRERGWRPTLALTQGLWHDPAAYLAVHPYAPVELVTCGAGTQASRVWEAARVIVRTAPDLVAVVNLPDVILAAARLRQGGRFAGRIVAVEHGFAHESLADMRRLAPTLDALVSTNRLTSALACRFSGLSPTRIFYAPCGAPTTTVRRRVLDRSGDALNLLYVGRLEAEQKRIHDLARLVSELVREAVPFRLRIAGGGPEEQELRRRLAGPGKNVEFLGVVDAHTLCENVLPQADALIVVSAWETGPIVAWEAMAAGVPVVCSRYIGSGAERALVDGENCLMFPVGDMRAAAAAVARLRDTNLAARLSRGGSALVEARYSREISIARWDEVFREIVAAPPLAPVPLRETLRASGRLDRWFGPEVGDALRRSLGLVHQHKGPGGEWPHLLSNPAPEDDDFADLVVACESGLA